LAVENPKLSVPGQNVSVPVLKNQRLNAFLFLILKRSLPTTTTTATNHPPSAFQKRKRWRVVASPTPLRTVFQDSKTQKAETRLATYGALFKARLQGGVLAHGQHPERKFSEMKLSVRLRRPH